MYPCRIPRRLRQPRAPGGALLLAVLLSLLGCREAPQAVVFGLAGPFSEGYGQSMQRGAELAAREINAAGGIRGLPLQFHVLDDAAKPERAVVVAQRFFADPAVLAVVGHVNSGPMIEAGSIYGRGLPAVATSATSPALSQLGPWVFRVASSDSANAVALARALSASRTRTALLYENDSYGRGLELSFRTALQASGGLVISADPYHKSTQDFTPFLQRMRAREVETIFIAGLEDSAARIISQARALGMDTRFIGGDGLEGLTEMGAEYEGTRVGLLFHPNQSPHARSFSERFRAEYGREADSFAALGYDAVQLLARAATEAGLSRSVIRAYLEKVGTPGGHAPFAGVSGTIRFDSNGDPLDKEFAIGTVHGGRITLKEGW